MFTTIFFTVLRSIAVPVVAILILRNTFLEEQGSFLAVIIALTISNVLIILFQIIKILPNALLLKGNSIIRLILKIIIEVASTIGFWIYYLTNVHL